MAALRSVVLLLLVCTGASAESKYIQFQIYVYLYYMHALVILFKLQWRVTDFFLKCVDV